MAANQESTNLYHYTPSAVAAYIFIVLFGLATIANFIRMIHLRAWYCIPLILGSICETIGYAGRAMSHNDPTSRNNYVIQSLLILCAAPLVAGTVYMTLGRLVRTLHAEKSSVISPRWLTKVHVLIDIICILSQLAGAGLAVTGNLNITKIGSYIVLAGLLFQVVALVFFLVIAGKVHHGIVTKGRRSSRRSSSVERHSSIRWQKYFVAIYIAVACMTLRNLVRAIEYGQGRSGFISYHEVFLYLFDALLMFIAVAALLVFHPGALIRQGKQVTEVELRR